VDEIVDDSTLDCGTEDWILDSCIEDSTELWIEESRMLIWVLDWIDSDFGIRNTGTDEFVLDW
jgi:hypothetical protein